VGSTPFHRFETVDRRGTLEPALSYRSARHLPAGSSGAWFDGV